MLILRKPLQGNGIIDLMMGGVYFIFEGLGFMKCDEEAISQLIGPVAFYKRILFWYGFAEPSI